VDQSSASRVQAPFRGINWIFASCPIVGRANLSLIWIIAPRRNDARERFVGERRRSIGRKSPAFWPNITVSRIENWLSSNVALCAIWEIPDESPHRPILRQSANPRRHRDGAKPRYFPPCGVHSSRITAGNVSIPRPPRRRTDLIGQSGLAHKADRPNESRRANVRESHAEL
jgi:hypothetical protein